MRTLASSEAARSGARLHASSVLATTAYVPPGSSVRNGCALSAPVADQPRQAPPSCCHTVRKLIGFAPAAAAAPAKARRSPSNAAAIGVEALGQVTVRAPVGSLSPHAGSR